MSTSPNEADGEIADQPRLFFAPYQAPHATPRYGRARWLVLIPLSILTLSILAVCTSTANRETPPALQSFTRPSPANAPVASVHRREKQPEPFIRVNVTPGGEDSFQLQLHGRCDVISLDTQKELSIKPDSKPIKVSSTKSGLLWGTQRIDAQQIELRPEKSPGVRINGHLYRGVMRLYRRTDGQVSAVNVLPIEEYLASVVDSEMPAKFPDAARQAQAIVARTYALYQKEHAEPKAVFDLLSSQRSQKYLGVEYLDKSGKRLAGESESSRRAVKATRGVVCQHDGRLFCTYYSAVCGGQTTSGHLFFKDAVSLLKPVPCEWCQASPHYKWQTEISQNEFRRKVLQRGDSNTKTPIREIRQVSRSNDKTLSRFEIEDGGKRVVVSGADLRERLPQGLLSSPHFQIRLGQDRVIFEGRGHGHGVGFCQWGAKGQAEAGKTSLEIIRHYYPGTEIKMLDY